MRVDGEHGVDNLHFHAGGTCHGSPTLKQCTDDAVRRCWEGRVLERTDTRNGVKVKCYSLIAFKFEHWAKYGRFVAEVRQDFRVVRIAAKRKKRSPK